MSSTALFPDKLRWWVIFDTCTRPEYYQDVHNLLALPRDVLLRYEYRSKYLSPAAIQAATNPNTAPLWVLLVYAQWALYKKDAPDPPPDTPDSQMLWIPT